MNFDVAQADKGLLDGWGLAYPRSPPQWERWSEAIARKGGARISSSVRL